MIWYSWHCVHYWSTLYAAGYNIIESSVIIECVGLCTAEIINTTWFNYSQSLGCSYVVLLLAEWVKILLWLAEWVKLLLWWLMIQVNQSSVISRQQLMWRRQRTADHDELTLTLPHCRKPSHTPVTPSLTVINLQMTFSFIRHPRSGSIHAHRCFVISQLNRK